MAKGAMAIATAARRRGLLTALWKLRACVTLAELDRLLQTRAYGEDLGQLTIADLIGAGSIVPRDEPVEDSVMRVFRARPGAWLSSGFFVRHLGLRRWTAQAVLAELAVRGCLLRAGSTSATRYCLAAGQRGDLGVKGH